MAAWTWTSVAAWTTLAVAVQTAATEPFFWKDWAREVFVDFIAGLGCSDCAQLVDPSVEMRFSLSSNVFGRADIDVLLPSLHWLYESSRSPYRLPGILVDGGANVGRATARWIASFGDSFSRQIEQNPKHVPCVVCSGSSASQQRFPGAEELPVSLVVVAVEPAEKNFQLLLRHAKEHAWEAEGFVPLQAALGATAGKGHLAVMEDFAIDEVATLLWEETDPRPKQQVEVMTLQQVVEAGQRAFPVPGSEGIFLLKLDIEGLEPEVLRSLKHGGPEVKFVSFEYASNVWKESLPPVLQDLHAAGYFCFLITSEHLFPVSGPFWSNIYELPMWSNFFCGREGDRDLEMLVQLHTGAIGLWPRMPKSYLADLADEEVWPMTLLEAQHRCTDLGSHCAGVTCERETAVAGSSRPGPPEGCTARRGTGGLRRSPAEEVSFLKDLSFSNLYLRYLREAQT